MRSSLSGGLADQVVVSFGNFALGVVLARTLPVADFGVYSVAMSFLLFFNTLHQAFIVYPLSVHAAAAPEAQYRHLLRVAAVLSPLAALVLLPVLAAALSGMGHLALFPLTALALFAWQAQEVMRRGLIARRRHGRAILFDAVRYVAPFAVVMAFAGRVTVAEVFLLIAAASLVGILPLLPTLRHGLGAVVRDIPRELLAHWRMAAPVLAANLLAVFTTQWFLWIFAWRHQPENAAGLVALTNIVAIASPVMLGAENILVPEIARARGRLAFASLIRMVAKHMAACLALVAPFFLAIVFYPTFMVKLVYGHATPYAANPLALEILAGVYACYLLSCILGAALRGYRAGGAALRMQLYPALLGLTLGSFLAIRYGITGAALAALLAGLMRVATGFVHVLRLRGKTAGGFLPGSRAPAGNSQASTPV